MKKALVAIMGLVLFIGEVIMSGFNDSFSLSQSVIILLLLVYRKLTYSFALYMI